MKMKNELTIEEQKMNILQSVQEQDMRVRERASTPHKFLLNTNFRATAEEMLILHLISESYGYNRNIPAEQIEEALQHKGEWNLAPMMFHDHKDGQLTERHLRCTVRFIDHLGHVSEQYFLDIPLDFQVRLQEVQGMIAG
jgi:hypothetical protein